VNPVSHLADTSRALMAGDVTSGDILYVLVAAAIVTAIFAPITNHLYKTRG
jgi:ABC-2 type transport system permease protein